MCKKTKKLIHDYWGRTEFGQKMILSDFVSDDDLLFLIPGNVKPMFWLVPNNIFTIPTTNKPVRLYLEDV